MFVLPACVILTCKCPEPLAGASLGSAERLLPIPLRDAMASGVAGSLTTPQLSQIRWRDGGKEVFIAAGIFKEDLGGIPKNLAATGSLWHMCRWAGMG